MCYIIFYNFIKLLSLNKKVVKALENKYSIILEHELHQFSAHEFASKINVKGFLAHDIDDIIVLFKEGKKIAQSWNDVEFVETKGLGHKLHDEELYQKIASFLTTIDEQIEQVDKQIDTTTSFKKGLLQQMFV